GEPDLFILGESVDGVSTPFYLSRNTDFNPPRDDYAIIVGGESIDTIQLAGAPSDYSLEIGTLFTPNDGLIFINTNPPQLVGVVVNAGVTGGTGFDFV
ncbi:MAG: hypothetical protein SWJ54_19370, partial [Cyanobacteriota bacterium]|nr:hypothetical protein [Cyanobacteriota bacterium]